MATSIKYTRKQWQKAFEEYAKLLKDDNEAVDLMVEVMNNNPYLVKLVESHVAQSTKKHIIIKN